MVHVHTMWFQCNVEDLRLLRTAIDRFMFDEQVRELAAGCSKQMAEAIRAALADFITKKPSPDDTDPGL